MCGIAGYIGNKTISSNVINETLSLMNKRGPDSQKFSHYTFRGKNIYLLHSRLSIIDLGSRANQPFIYKHATIIYNGEIYNYVEVRDNLIKKGYKFKTNSDTEVLLKAYIEYGEGCVNYFNGMWSFAIWNNKTKKLFLSRDRFGEKPFYFFQDNNGFYFASEIKAIQSLLNEKLKINYNQIKRYLVYGYKFLNKTPETYFERIHKLDSATCATINSKNDLKLYKYWNPKSNIKKMSLSEAIEGTKHYLFESMRLRLRADVPLAFCLSGGVDSASLASIAKKKFNYDVTTFSIIDNDNRYNELDNIKATIKDLDCKNYLIYLNHEDAIGRLNDLVSYHDAPLATISYLIHSMLSEKINDYNYKISISGTSADELFTGYYDHFNLYLYEMRNSPNYQNYLNDWKENTGKFVRNPFLKNPELYFNDQTIRNHNHLNSDLFKSYLVDDFSMEITESIYDNSLLRNRMLNELFHEATPIILNEDDLNSMRFSIENRSPYLDVNLFDFAYSIPNELLIQNGYGKFILREAMEGILNEKVRLDRRKKGFNASIQSLLNFNDKSTIDFLLQEGPIFDIIKKNKIESLFNNQSYKNSENKFIFNFINTKIFLDKFS